MSTKVIKGEISCARTNHNKIHIAIKCSSSRAEFLDVEITAEQFGQLVTGMYLSDINMSVDKLDIVGKKKVVEVRSVEFSNKNGLREYQEQWLVDNCQEEGWTINPYLRSQSSVKYVDGKTILNYTVYKYIDI